LALRMTGTSGGTGIKVVTYLKGEFHKTMLIQLVASPLQPS
jgi:hypothetical protein